MAKFEDRGYCPFNEIIHTQEKVWDELSEKEKGCRSSLWELVGPYMVCDPEKLSHCVEAGKLFFGTRYLANTVLKEIIKRYNFQEAAPIWIKQPREGYGAEVNVAEYVLRTKKPEIIFDSTDAGKLVVVSDGENGELIVALWNRSIEI